MIKQILLVSTYSNNYQIFQASEVSTEIGQNVDARQKEAGVSEVPEMAMATAKQPEAQAATLGGDVTISGKNYWTFQNLISFLS